MRSCSSSARIAPKRKWCAVRWSTVAPSLRLRASRRSTRRSISSRCTVAKVMVERLTMYFSATFLQEGCGAERDREREREPDPLRDRAPERPRLDPSSTLRRRKSGQAWPNSDVPAAASTPRGPGSPTSVPRPAGELDLAGGSRSFQSVSLSKSSQAWSKVIVPSPNNCKHCDARCTFPVFNCLNNRIAISRSCCTAKRSRICTASTAASEDADIAVPQFGSFVCPSPTLF